MKIKSHLLGMLFLSGVAITACNAQNENNEATNQEENQVEQSAMVHEDVDVQTFARLKEEGGLLLDVRTPGEYSEGHLEGATHIDFYSDDFKDEIAKLDKETPVYVYCRSGGRSGKTMDMMKSMGFEKVYNLAGGITAWQGEGKPVVTE